MKKLIPFIFILFFLGGFNVPSLSPLRILSGSSVLGQVPARVGVVGGGYDIPALKELLLPALGTLHTSTFNENTFANDISKINISSPRVISVSLLPISYSSFALGGISAKAQSLSSSKRNLPFVDQLSLSIFCSLASLSTTVDKSRCNYNTLLTQTTATDTTVVATESTEVSTTTLSIGVPESSTTPAKTPTFASVSNSPVYINNYITKYIEGPAGPQGPAGKDGVNGKDAIAYSNYITPPSYSPTPQSLIGVSTIGYLRGTTIEYANFSYGTSTNMYLSNANIATSVFNGLNTFNDTALFTGNVTINSLTATSSNLLNTTLTNSTTTNAVTTNATTTNSYISNLANDNAVVTNSTTTNAVVTNSTTTNAFISSLAVDNASTTNLSATGATITNLTVSTNASTSAITGSALNFTNGFFTGLTATNASTTNLSATGATFGSTNTTGTATIANASTTNLSATGATLGNLTVTTNASTSALTGNNLNFTNAFFSGLTSLNASTTNLTVASNAYFGANTGIWNSSGNIGIGTTTPTSKLSIVTSTVPALTAKRNISTFFQAIGEFTDTNGNVGVTIGGTSLYASGPTTNQELDISSRGSGILYLNSSGLSTGNIIMASAGGNVAIGTTTPSSMLTVSGTSTLIGSTVSPTALKAIGNIDNTAAGIDLTKLGSVSISGSPSAISAVGHYAYVVNATSKMYVVDVSNPSFPTLVGSSSLLSSASNISVTGNYAYVLCASGGLCAYDITNPYSPTFVGSTTLPSNTSNLYASGRYVYTVHQSITNKLQITDVSNPASPVKIGSVTVGSDPTSVFVYGKYAYVNNNSSNSVSIVDISDPANPVVVSTLATANNPKRVLVSGRYAYIGSATTNTLQVADVSSSTAPVIVGTVSTTGNTNGLALFGRYVVGANGSQVDIIDVSSSTAPVIVATTTPSSSPTSLAISGRYAYVNTSNSLQVIDLGGLETTSAIIHSLQAGNLQVRNDVSTQGNVSVGSTLNVGNGGIFSLGSASIFGSGAATSSVLSVASSSGSSLFNVLTNGNVGVGSSSPNFKLDVAGIVNATAFYVNGVVFSGGSSQWTTGSNGAIYYASGNVGIGTTTPGVILTVASSTASGTTNLFSVATTSQIFNILANGNVGIASSSPNFKLDVNGAVNATSFFQNGVAFTGSSQWTTGTGLIYYTAGSVGVGTTTSNAILTVSSSTATGVTNLFAVSTTTQIFNVLANGNVGIASSSPNFKLDVNGSVNATGFFQNGVAFTGSSQWTTGSGGIISYTGGNVGVGTTTPTSILSVSSTTATGTTGLFSVSTSTVLFTVLANGRVGIGTTTPNATLDIKRPYDGTNGVILRLGDSGLSTTNFDFARNISTGALSLQGNQVGNNNIILAPTSGNVGIGTPTPGYTLDVNGAVNATSVLINGVAVGAGGTQWASGAGGVISYTGGSVGIGTTTPSGSLMVMANSSAEALQILGRSADSIGQIMFYSNNGNTAQARIDSRSTEFRLMSFGTIPLTFMTGAANTERMRIDQNGNVGIGTTTATSILTVSSSTATGATSLFSVSTTTTAFNILANGNIGVGSSSPNFKLDVAGIVNATAFYVNGVVFSGGSSQWTTGSNGAIYYASGNVGIGTTTPGVILTVASSTASGTTNLFAVATTSQIFNILANGNIGVGSSTPFTKFYVNGESASNYFTALATTSTSTLLGGLDVGSGGLVYDFSSGVTSVSNAEFGALSFDTNAGVVSWFDLPVTSSAATNTIESYTAQIGGTDLMTMYGESNGIGGVQNLRVGIGTTTPTAFLTIASSTASGTSRLFSIASSTELLTVLANGNIGISSTTPSGSLSIVNTSVQPALDISYVGSIGGSGIKLSRTGSSAGSGFLTVSATAAFQVTNGAFTASPFNVYQTAPDALMNLIATGVAVGTVTASAGYGVTNTMFTVDAGASSIGSVIKTAVATNGVEYLWNAATTGDNLFTTFATEAGGTTRGTIAYNRAGGLVAYNTTSDARLKNILGYASSTVATGRLSMIKVRDYEWKETPGVSHEGFIAQELYEANPEAVTVGGDDPHKNPWQIDRSALIPDLVLGWQTHQIEISSLQNKDLAFYTPSEALDLGTVIAFSDVSTSTIKKATNSSEAIGIVTTSTNTSTTTAGIPVAFSGKVTVQVTNENGTIHKGDYLTVSTTTPGKAERLTQEGQSLGRALTDDDGTGRITMVLNTGYQKVDTSSPTATTTGMLTTGNLDLNANAVAIYNIKSLASANGSWSIDENGRITAKVLCIEDVCIDKTTLTNILNSTGQTSVNLPGVHAFAGEITGTTTTSTSTTTSDVTPPAADSSSTSTSTDTTPITDGGVSSSSTAPVIDFSTIYSTSTTTP